MLQGLVVVLFPMHSAPPLAASWEMFLVPVCVPPQVLEHASQIHSLHSQSTEKQVAFMKFLQVSVFSLFTWACVLAYYFFRVMATGSHEFTQITHSETIVACEHREACCTAPRWHVDRLIIGECWPTAPLEQTITGIFIARCAVVDLREAGPGVSETWISVHEVFHCFNVFG